MGTVLARQHPAPGPPAGAPAVAPRPPALAPAPAPAVPRPAVGFHGAVSEFKRRLIEATLAQAGGNRTRAARALGLQRTYLLRLMRELGIQAPPAPAPPRRTGADTTALPPQTR
jgi:DNA-binding NtrC family response regulator